MPEWDELNRPVGYIIGVTPGFSRFGHGEEQLIYMGLARKITRAARFGFEFAQIDFESLSEMFEPEIGKLVNIIKNRQNIEVGVHLPVEMDLCLAHAYQWKLMHRRLVYGALAAEKLKAKYILFHTSSYARPAISAGVGERTAPAKMAAWNGINLGNWIENVSKTGFDLKNWFMARFIEVLFRAMGVAGDPGVVSYFAEEVAVQKKKGFKEGEEMARKELQEIEDSVITPVLREINEQIEKNRRDAQQLRTRIEEILRERERLPQLELTHKSLTEEIKRLEELLIITRDKERRREIEINLRRLRRELATIDEEIHRIKSNLKLIPQMQKRIEELDRINSKLSSSEYRNRKIIETLQTTDWNGKKAWDRYRQLEGVVSYLNRTNFYEIYRYWTTQGSECEESVAYHVVAKWMYVNKDALYTSIVTEDKRDPDEIIFEANTKLDVKPSIPEAVKQIITAVAAKYIQGHLTVNQPEEYAIEIKQQTKTLYLSVLEFCKRNKVHIFIETNMPGEEGRGAPPGELRIIKATDHVKIVKTIDPENISYCMDFEHLLTNYVDPEEEAKELVKIHGGNYIRCLHVNAPRPIVGAHAPIMPISNDMYILYRYLYTLRKAGVKNAYIIWEMGSYGVRESAVALRRLVDELEKETEPENLPAELFGIDKTFLAIQNTAIKEHAFDPLIGMIRIPEEIHTFLSRAAVERGKAAEWRRERYR